jgi:hypothetical protein
MSNILKKKEIPLAIIWICVLIVFADYFFGGPIFNPTFQTLTVDWTVIIANIAIIVGGLSVLQRSVILAQRSSTPLIDRLMHVWLFCCSALLIIVGSLFGIQNTTYNWIYSYILLPSWRTVYTIIIFFMATAAYRAYRARTVASFVMVACGLLVLIRNAPIGQAIWSGFYPIGTWILDVVNLSGSRAIMIGSMIGAVSLLIKIMIGKEKILGGGDE